MKPTPGEDGAPGGKTGSTPVNRRAFTPDIRQAPPLETVCWCAGVTKAQILAARAAGARSLEAIKSATGACAQGRCRETNPRGH